MTRISAGSHAVAFDSQTAVRVVSMRRVDSQGNLASLDGVANRPVAIVSARPRPSAPPLAHDDFRADFAGARSPERALSPHPSRGTQPWSFDMPLQTDGPADAPPAYSVTPPAHPWGTPPPYSAVENTPHRPLPGGSGPASPPAYSPPSLAWMSGQGYPDTTV